MHTAVSGRTIGRKTKETKENSSILQLCPSQNMHGQSENGIRICSIDLKVCVQVTRPTE